MTEEKKYTVLTPKTSFGLKPNPKNDEKTAALWDDQNLYASMRGEAEGRDFVLHDGPPYANGNIHIGHAMNKILKDMTNRHRYNQGRNINYVPGWDCHGLPIEWKVEEEYRKAGKDKDEDILAFREDCRQYAKGWLDIQREEFKQLGILGDWENPYTTMSFENESSIVQQLHKFLMADLLTQKNKPIMWSPVEKTSLAEAEVDYVDVKTETAYVALKLDSSIAKYQDAKLLVWTTTPWTLPGNKAVAYNSEIEYCILTTNGQKFLLAKNLVENFTKLYGHEADHVHVIKNTDFNSMTIYQPVYGNRVPLLEADFVTEEQGTGFVHIAPGHGMDDFELGLKHGLNTDSIINDNACYVDTLEVFKGMHVYKANIEVMKYLTAKGNLVCTESVTHSYPHSWRSKKPVIYRTTPQWFIEVEKFRDKSMKAIDDVNWFPMSGRNRLFNMVKDRHDWCISRQRSWGVPIMLFIDHKTGELLTDYKVNEKIVNEVKEHGCDVWFEKPPSYFIDEDDADRTYTKVMDILDVWFDSGSTHAFVLNNKRADVYLEGSDQHRGWFQSSLLISTALGGTAPYKDVVTHGFVMADKNAKMSKSDKTGMTPQAITKQYGTDTLRLWCATIDFTSDVTINQGVLKQLNDQVKKFRNTMRYCLGNLHDKLVVETVPYEDLPELDQYFVNKMVEVTNDIKENVGRYQYSKIVVSLSNLCNELSSLYFDVRKDCLYCDAKDSKKRQATLYMLSLVFDFLTLHLSPIIPFSVHEACNARGVGTQYFTRNVDDVKLPRTTVDQALMDKWDYLKTMRSEVTMELEKYRQDGHIGSSLEASLNLKIPESEQHHFNNIDLAEFFIVSSVTMFAHSTVRAEIGVNTNNGKKCPRCWIYHEDTKDLCPRCEGIENNG